MSKTFGHTSEEGPPPYWRAAKAIWATNIHFVLMWKQVTKGVDLALALLLVQRNSDLLNRGECQY